MTLRTIGGNKLGKLSGSEVFVIDDPSSIKVYEVPDEFSHVKELKTGTICKALVRKSSWLQFQTWSGQDGALVWAHQPTRNMMRVEPQVVEKDRNQLEYAPVAGQLFHEVPCAADVVQGYLSDCFFMGAIASIADKIPEAIRHMIKEITPGIYDVTFHNFDERGICVGKTVTRVDNWFPTKNSRFYYAFGDPEGRSEVEYVSQYKALWPAVLEKAFACTLGSYDKLDQGGSPAFVFSAITGFRAISMSMKYGLTARQISVIKDRLTQGSPVVASTSSTLKHDLIHDDHVYMVESIEDNVVTVRNPWHGEQKILVTLEEFLKCFEQVCMLAQM